jgi:hypothetical protein
MHLGESRCSMHAVARVRRVGVRGASSAAIGLSAVIMAAAMADAQPTYRLVEVPPAGSRSSYLPQVDPTGTYVAGLADEGFQPRVFLWSGGTSTYGRPVPMSR